MAIQDFFSDEERERQAALTRSWEAGKRLLSDPEVRARVKARLAEIDSHLPAEPLTGDEFLARVGVERQPTCS